MPIEFAREGYNLMYPPERLGGEPVVVYVENDRYRQKVVGDPGAKFGYSSTGAAVANGYYFVPLISPDTVDWEQLRSDIARHLHYSFSKDDIHYLYLPKKQKLPFLHKATVILLHLCDFFSWRVPKPLEDLKIYTDATPGDPHVAQRAGVTPFMPQDVLEHIERLCGFAEIQLAKPNANLGASEFLRSARYVRAYLNQLKEDGYVE